MLAWSVLISCSFARPAAESAESAAPLTTAASVLALPVEVAEKKLPVVIRGVVTAAEPDWAGKFVVQDETAGVFVQNVGRQPAIGDFIEVTGATGPGLFAPVLQFTDWKKLGHAPLPPAKQVTVERLMAGVEASQRIEITGLVRSVSYVPSQKTQVEVSLGGYRVRVFPKLPSTLDPRSLVAAKVRVRGTAATSFNAARRHLTAVNLMVPSAEDFVVEQPELHPPWEQPAVPLGDIARYRAHTDLSERLHVKGTLTFQRPGLDLFLQDATGGLHVQSDRPLRLPPGTAVEAVGFLEFVNYQPVLRDAVFRELAEPARVAEGAAVPFAELRDGQHGAELIVLRGELLDRSVRPVRREAAGFVGVRTICTVRNAEQSFTAECEEAEGVSHLAEIPLGSTVEVRGIASYESGDDGKPKSITLLLPDAASLRLVQRPSWFTAERLLIGFGVVCVLLAAVAGWLLTVSRKNVMLKFLVQEREKAQRELQQAHDQLELRVRERTEQLKVEMTVRKTAEVEFRATLAERTRLARELHDTLEQALTGIALQLDTAAKLFQRNPADAGQPLELARGFLKQSQLELRRSIWDLRSRELEQFDLPGALAIASRQISAGNNVAIELETEGDRKRLPEIVEENLLRIAQEALTNVVKHSGATLATVRLAFAAESVALEIKDNGRGLDAALIAARGDRRFGLLGMSERAKRLGGRFEVSSTPGEGTTVRVFLSLGNPALQESAARAEGEKP